MAAKQPFLQNESSGLPPACKPKLQQAGVYYLVSGKKAKIKGWQNFTKVQEGSAAIRHFNRQEFRRN